MIADLVSLRDAPRSKPRLRILLWALAICIVLGAIEFGEPLDDTFKAARDILRSRPASGEIVVIGIDDRTGARYGGFSFSRRIDAKLVDKLFAAGAERVFFDRVYADETNPADDAAFAAALARHPGRVFLGAISPPGESQERVETLPRPQFRKVAPYRSLNGGNTPFMLSAKLAFADRFEGKLVPSLSSEIAGWPVSAKGYYRPDWSIRMATVPTYSFVDVIDGRVPKLALAGKDVIVGPTSPTLRDVYPILFQGRFAGVYFHVIGAETLRAGTPRDWGWLPPFGSAVLLSCLFLLAQRRLTRLLTIAVALATFAALPVFLASRLIEVDVFPALLLVAIVAYRGFSLARVEATRRTNPASDLPNLVALIESEAGDAPTVIALKLRNQAEIVASFPNDVARALIGEVERRLRVAGGSDQLYHGEDGLFWTSRQPVSDELLQHLRGLHKLLAQPIQLGDRSVDLLTAFGIDGSTDRPLTSRIASATLSAEEAARANEIWKLYDPQRNHAAAWQLSLMGRLDFAIESGELWVAYQPKVSLPTRQIVGMEALVRWNHPTAGPLNPVQFIAAAEAHNKIAALTYFVLDRALADLAALHAAGHMMGVSVNLSPKLLEESDLVERLSEALARHRVLPSDVTLEITETGDLLSVPGSIETMQRLVATGVKLSIDDYGTGNATLEYLARLPSHEVKIDRTFITDLDQNRDNLILVRATLEMAHRLGRHVVAEGVENEEVLRLLQKLGCDIAQGYLLSRPIPFADLLALLDADSAPDRVRLVIS
ncbi:MULTISPECIES: EAL domain-containing protein [Sphingomonas]|uniref:EAL domain-containing protein n=1 Tax=Sphingomonas TaxID=13687 RepID=UPI0015EBF06C|nr:EAL domain-containing protein [Sphingomonas sp. CGMCC 1.13658]MBA2919987.1 EAL domain-containing protein [Sphingomonas sp. CGMCC 1.13658]